MSLGHRMRELCLTSYILHKLCGCAGFTKIVLRKTQTHKTHLGYGQIIHQSYGKGRRIVTKRLLLDYNKRLAMGEPSVSTVGICRPLQLIGSISIIGVLSLFMLLSIFSNIQ